MSTNNRSIFRQPDARHYTVVHRSQRDPLINDPSAGDRVLHQVHRPNQNKTSKAQTRHELESSLGTTPTSSSAGSKRKEDPSMYDIFYDDLDDYDYMQHLRPLGLNKDAILIEKPTKKNKNKTTTGENQQLFGIKLSSSSSSPLASTSSSEHAHPQHGQQAINLPSSVVPTPNEEMLSYKDHLEFALPSHSAFDHGSLLPNDSDPGLREVLVALEDEEYIEDEADDDFFGAIVKDGQRDQSEQLEWVSETITESSASASSSLWESNVEKFKSIKLDEDEDEDDDGDLRSIDSNQPKKSSMSHKSLPSMAGSNFSMSSSAMFRNKGLTDLDDRFEKIERDYDKSSSDEEETSDSESDGSNLTETPKNRIREDFDEIMDEFLERFEVIGGKMKPILEGQTSIDKLKTMRNELLGSDEDEIERRQMKEKILKNLIKDQENRTSETKVAMVDGFCEEEEQEKWDCQSILSTYSNLENHPRIIKMREVIGKKIKQDKNKKIEIDRITGFPKVIEEEIKEQIMDEDEDESDLESTATFCETIKRDRNETKEEKKNRKSELKLERAERRKIKKNVKEKFNLERKKQEKKIKEESYKKSIDIGGFGGKGILSLS